VLVVQDMLGMYGDLRPKFVKRYAEAGALIRQAAEAYCREVREGRFPDAGHSFQ
jgi:3-methyl-2-oxobutanoate hydroxymethyltransferase